MGLKRYIKELKTFLNCSTEKQFYETRIWGVFRYYTLMQKGNFLVKSSNGRVLKFSLPKFASVPLGLF